MNFKSNYSAFGFIVTESAECKVCLRQRADSLLAEFTHFHGLCSKVQSPGLN